MMLYKPNLYDTSYRDAEMHSINLFTSSTDGYTLMIARGHAERFRGIEIDTLFDAYTRNPIRQEMFTEIVEKLAEADALNAAQTERYRRIVTAEK